MSNDEDTSPPEQERSGSHKRAAVPAQQDWIAMNARSIIFALAGLLTGTMGVGGFTFAATNNNQPTAAAAASSAEVAKMTAEVSRFAAEVARLSANVAETNSKLVSITVTLAEMKATSESGSREDKKRDESLADHETRLRRLERPGR